MPNDLVQHDMDLKEVRALLTGKAQRRARILVADSIARGLAMMQRHHIKHEMIRRKGKTHKGARKGSQKLFYRTGTLAKSYRVHHQKNRLIGSYGSNLPRAAKLETGGEIRPKTKRYLAIPLPGVKGWPRERKDLFFLKSKRGQPMLAKQDGDKITVQYLLRRRVNLRPRPTLQNTIDKKKPQVYALVEKALAKGLGENAEQSTG